ncbi:putative omega-hydroxypalmitate O-feruloyl transferase [Helianthus annuus]|uniref:Omega-hydroxypalmitate O-feruloyl transferase n=1 Tax=Helianthus annuus TaxID=4232 RepID=A0A251URE7_HELAN|nr:omega-hydroxypalmitate O-feruloyl transferase isoform X2 [Helianthus annuus]KAF5805403.1 putative omega-hydroxypalmitate O-feruloyl transferase [Helianthus annuus]KAJ0569843.1 putative omega-hydroxypalmitate O-feruloyl transferase [Helianthus annuus]KAJ0584167.1 putative omega-hydroxypalmitate O-feruloyl transferase [Helianthus annuus]KAJ0746755.1 putative omega-hydroxypalmitate O-feruloyl transferase [Helianthus annuus]KAJ0749836.1 putative omega-hydroxypalmitate O-feruloyl transferase [He
MKSYNTMGSVYQAHTSKSSTPNIIVDLKVIIHETVTILPPQQTEKRSMFLSNIDQVLNFNVETVHFFVAHPEFPPESVAEKLKSALSKALVPYDFLAGRLRLNPESQRFEFDCNGAGAQFVVGSSEFELGEIGDLVYPNPGFRQLVQKSYDDVAMHDRPVCILQLTSFKCGGFALGVATNHATFDGISFKTFLENLASLAAGKPLATVPCNDRYLLAARSPPQIQFDHPELVKIPTGVDLPKPTVFDCPEGQLNFKIFNLTSNDIARLKKKAKDGWSGGSSNAKITGFNVVAAHVWRCKALSSGSDYDPERVSTVLYAVDIRSRLNLPSSLAGNAVLSAYASARCKEIEEAPLVKLVELVTQGTNRMTGEYAQSVIDWGEVNKGFPNGEFLISSWWRLGFADVEYPWGKPRYSCPVVYHRKDIILLFPDIVGSSDNNEVNVLVALPSKEMEKFEVLFHKLLA